MLTNPPQMFAGASMGETAYRAWAAQARRERRLNIARLFEALSTSRAVSADRAFKSLVGTMSTASCVACALGGLNLHAISSDCLIGANPLAHDLLERANRALAEDRDLRWDELGDLYVCSSCGELRERQITTACPVCGTVPESHRSFRAIDAMGTLGPHGLMHCLEHTRETLMKLAEGLDDAMVSSRPAPDRPSFKELIGHLADIDAVFRERAWLLLETDHPMLPPAHPPRLRAAEKYRERPIAETLDAFYASRRQTINLLRGLTSAAWHRTGFHELYGEINLLHQGNWVTSHERAHMVELAQLRHDLLAGRESTFEPFELAELVVVETSEGE